MRPLRDTHRLGHIHNYDACLPFAQNHIDFFGRGFVRDERDERIGVEQSQCRRASAAASSFRACDRSEVVGPSFPFSAPRAAVIGSSGSGRITTRSPKSSTATELVFHLLRTLAGSETWPPVVTLWIF